MIVYFAWGKLVRIFVQREMLRDVSKMKVVEPRGRILGHIYGSTLVGEWRSQVLSNQQKVIQDMPSGLCLRQTIVTTKGCILGTHHVAGKVQCTQMSRLKCIQCRRVSLDLLPSLKYRCV